MDGWAVDFLGANTPALDLATFVAGRRPQVVALSVTLPEHLSQAERAIGELRNLADPPSILLGGSAVHERVAVAQAAGADVITGDAWDAVQRARAYVTTAGEPLPLDRLLRELGERIREQRRARHWSQQQLGDAAGLDRTYVNAVEQGKQNLTAPGAMLIGKRVLIRCGRGDHKRVIVRATRHGIF
jgi:DNA-binding XRE family transcriptional regulator